MPPHSGCMSNSYNDTIFISSLPGQLETSRLDRHGAPQSILKRQRGMSDDIILRASCLVFDPRRAPRNGACNWRDMQLGNPGPDRSIWNLQLGPALCLRWLPLVHATTGAAWHENRRRIVPARQQLLFQLPSISPWASWLDMDPSHHTPLFPSHPLLYTVTTKVVWSFFRFLLPHSSSTRAVCCFTSFRKGLGCYMYDVERV